jgi:purine-nucleoside phosphorylase
LPLPCTILVHQALRGEGASYAYLPPADRVAGNGQLLAAVSAELQRAGIVAITGSTWTTDAPFRETRSVIASAQAAGAQAVEMEIAGLYAFAQACQKPVVCFALITNQMAQAGDDFEKGADNGASHALALVAAASRAWSSFAQGGHHRE